jgi:hypothetical protein
MRIWLIKNEELSDMHLLGQHRESHMLFAMLNNKRFQSHPLVIFYRDKYNWLRAYHDSLVQEMDFRFDHLARNQGQHQTPVPSEISGGLSHWEVPPGWVEFDQKDLTQRYLKAPAKKYKWTKRIRPQWSYNLEALKCQLGDIPAYVLVKPHQYKG